MERYQSGIQEQEIPEHMTAELNQQLIDFVQTADFATVQGHIYPYPIECLGANTDQKAVIHDLRETCPSFYRYGFQWYFILDLSQIFPVLFWDYISFDMLSGWDGISMDQIRHAAVENINQKLSSISVSLLYDTTNPRTAVATYELVMQDMTALPEYGCSILLSRRYLETLHKQIGNYYLLPYKVNAVYLIREKDVARSDRTVQDIFEAVLACNYLLDADVLSRRVLFYSSNGMKECGSF